ncbi:uncharacterized protein SPPG_05998 [Spizellomyces punctatus DAOM BR117]|uniref:Calponin-homology (CH) domain-containing protein n=1 Tax=Spizellomyces punctatus (strain DAOM BR117) TaxID=645134 RepID=A0A0L0HE63_SPIPD|nr:uncharacterized protein SPPG_05998 [Spizellomyces punctatus DAOM BR117]KNC99048.1 hypothetical protein SPPG_05998 [Spizellomyces punctatus DAOM BR117]|eukprot:XP_016607088.1 hypothetical protein SPPG_05998 [Spizellomyces punctatus DAOM BR117]
MRTTVPPLSANLRSKSSSLHDLLSSKTETNNGLVHEQTGEQQEDGGDIPASPAATHGIHSWSDSETSAYISWINALLPPTDLDLAHLLPLTNAETFFDACRTGVLLAKLLDKTIPGSIPMERIHRKPKTEIHMRENCGLVLDACRKVGVKTLNIGPADVMAGVPHLCLALVWQIIKVGLMSKIQVDDPSAPTDQPKSKAGTSTQAVPQDRVLLQWINRELKRNGCPRSVSNFGTDLSDSECYAHLLSSIGDGGGINVTGVLQERDFYRRAEMVLDAADALGCRYFVTPKEIVAGNRKLSMAFLAVLHEAMIRLGRHGERDQVARHRETSETFAQQSSEIKRLKDELDTMRAKMKIVEYQNAELQQLEGRAMGEVGGYKKKVDALQTQVKELLAERSTLESEAETAQADAAALRKENGELQKKTRSLKEESGLLRAEIKALTSENRSLQQELDNLLQELRDQATELKEKLMEAGETVARMTTERVKLRAELDEMTIERAQLRQEIEAQTAARYKLEEELDMRQHELKRISVVTDSAIREKEMLHKRVSDMEIDIEATEGLLQSQDAPPETRAIQVGLEALLETDTTPAIVEDQLRSSTATLSTSKRPRSVSLLARNSTSDLQLLGSPLGLRSRASSVTSGTSTSDRPRVLPVAVQIKWLLDDKDKLKDDLEKALNRVRNLEETIRMLKSASEAVRLAQAMDPVADVERPVSEVVERMDKINTEMRALTTRIRTRHHPTSKLHTSMT